MAGISPELNTTVLGKKEKQCSYLKLQTIIMKFFLVYLHNINFKYLMQHYEHLC